MTESLEDALQRADSPVDFVRSPARGADTGHLRLFTDLPDEVTNWREEQSAWADSVALADLSHHMTDLHVEGPDALDLFSDLGINDFSSFEPGQAKQFAATSPDGYLIGDGILFHLGEDEFNLVGYGPINWVEFHAETRDYDVETERDEHGGLREGPPKTFRYQVQGPDALDLITEVVDGDLPEVPFFNFREVSIAGHEVNALRHGMLNEPGFEFFGPWEHAEDVRTAIMETGRDYDIRRIGAKAYPTNVITAAWMSIPLPAIYHDDDLLAEYREWLDVDSFEGALAIGGSLDSEDITDHYLTPVEAGHGRFVDLDHDFVGRDAVAEQLENEDRTRVTLVWDQEATTELYGGALFDDDATYRYTDLPVADWALTQNDRVLKDGDVVGVANNTRYLYFERRMFSLCAIDSELAEPGTEVSILWGEPDSGNPRVEDHEQTEVTATVAPAPYFEDKRKTADYNAN
ncbi:MAG: aminomethyl transferase family protein [Halobellus sp.]